MSSLNQQISQLFKAACIDELEALKPGNVHIFADGHGMTIHDFIKSADAVAKVIALPDLTLGQRILLSVEATQKAVNCNTNLGIILLCAPLVQAILGLKKDNFYFNLKQVLQHTTIDDAQKTFTAIALANPAGLGKVRQHDVYEPADCSLLEAMHTVAKRDLVAAQYANQYDAIFNLGLPVLQEVGHKNRAWITTQLYLMFLSTFADSHIVRKHGASVAGSIQLQANQHLTAFNQIENPKLYQSKLMAWDTQLKNAKINPGTSADLTVATLFAHSLIQLA